MAARRRLGWVILAEIQHAAPLRGGALGAGLGAGRREFDLGPCCVGGNSGQESGGQRSTWPTVVTPTLKYTF